MKLVHHDFLIAIFLVVHFANVVRSCYPTTSTPSGTTSTATTYSRCTTTSGATCRLGNCNGGETKLPSSSEFATETLCQNYTGKALCYDLTTTGASANYGTCVDDYAGCASGKVTLSNKLTDKLCGDWKYSWTRCMSYTAGTGTVICRPYEAGCNTAGGEIQQPNATQARLGAFSSRIFTLTDCTAMDPAFTCFSYATATTGVAADMSCVLDTASRTCTSPAVRIGTDVVYPSAAACAVVVAPQYIRCMVSGGTGKCIPYDPITAASCPASGTASNAGTYTAVRTPAYTVFDSFAACDGYSVAGYAACWDDTTMVITCEAGTSCTAPAILIATLDSQALCYAFEPNYTRCIEPATANLRKCVPSTVKNTACPGPVGTAYYASPSSKTYTSYNSCATDQLYTLCLCTSSNLLQCQPDHLGCEGLSATAGDCYAVLPYTSPFSNLSSCLSHAPTAYTLCVTRSTGVPLCRPYFNVVTGCWSNATAAAKREYTYSIVPYSTLDTCQAATSYYYCYDQTNPESAPTCVPDMAAVSGCTTTATNKLLRKWDGTADVIAFATKSLCEAYWNVTQWAICTKTADSSKRCRPYNAEIVYTAPTTIVTCATTDNALAADAPLYSTLAECVTARA